MTRDPRIQELLDGYPDALSDAELAELRAAAEQDPELDELLFAILETDAELAGADDGPGALSERAQARLDQVVAGVELPSPQQTEGTPQQNGPQAWSTGGALPTGSVNEAPQAWSTGGALPTGSADEAPQAWSTGGALPTGSAADPPQGKVTSLADARRRRLRQHPGFLAIAAGLLLAVGFVLRDALVPPPPEFTFKGDGTEGAIRGKLFVMGDVRIEDGARRPVDQAVAFSAQMTDPASIALLETQAGRTFVLHPPPGEVWQATPGPNRLVVGGQSSYRPALPGPARYTLIASPRPFDIPSDREVASPEAFGAAHEAVGLTELTITWEGVSP